MIQLQRWSCLVCHKETMLVALKNNKLEHAQCGNQECKSNKPEVNMKNNIQKLLNTAVLSPKEVPDVLEFVMELIDLELQYDLEKYPNAHISHTRQKQAYQVVRELEDFFNEHYKNAK